MNADTEKLILLQKRKILELQECVFFFASVIKFGEPWTTTCQEALDKAKQPLELE